MTLSRTWSKVEASIIEHRGKEDFTVTGRWQGHRTQVKGRSQGYREESWEINKRLMVFFIIIWEELNFKKRQQISVQGLKTVILLYSCMALQCQTVSLLGLTWAASWLLVIVISIFRASSSTPSPATTPTSASGKWDQSINPRCLLHDTVILFGLK